LNLFGLIKTSSFDARIQSVNALTEELADIRFPVHQRARVSQGQGQNIGA
jgi:hypothetical protein